MLIKKNAKAGYLVEVINKKGNKAELVMSPYHLGNSKKGRYIVSYKKSGKDLLITGRDQDIVMLEYANKGHKRIVFTDL